jgi:phospholipid/cholesterol/gamma-HCH transport system substrate-binding protein
VRDLLVGLFVISGMTAIAYLSLPLGGLTTRTGQMELFASFDEIGGLRPRAQVVVGGVRVGQVESVELDDDYRARVKLRVDEHLPLPEDTSAAILTSGLLGDQYIALEPGGSDVMLDSGAEIQYTQSAIVLERIVGRMVQNLGDQ